MVVALRAVRVLLPWGVLTEPQGRAGKKGSFGASRSEKELVRTAKTPYVNQTPSRITGRAFFMRDPSI